MARQCTAHKKSMDRIIYCSNQALHCHFEQSVLDAVYANLGHSYSDTPSPHSDLSVPLTKNPHSIPLTCITPTHFPKQVFSRSKDIGRVDAPWNKRRCEKKLKKKTCFFVRLLKMEVFSVFLLSVCDSGVSSSC